MLRDTKFEADLLRKIQGKMTYDVLSDKEAQYVCVHIFVRGSAILQRCVSLWLRRESLQNRLRTDYSFKKVFD